MVFERLQYVNSTVVRSTSKVVSEWVFVGGDGRSAGGMTMDACLAQGPSMESEYHDMVG